MMVGLRRAMGLHSAVRPVKLYPGIESCLNTGDQGIDFVILRENLEGLYELFESITKLRNHHNSVIAFDSVES